jgi:CheY-like chemotaxis protein
MARKGAYILGVDDEIEVVRVLRRSLTTHGYTAFTASLRKERSICREHGFY